MPQLRDVERHNIVNKPRILFVGEAIALAHVGRPALLAAWARQTGYEVRLTCGPAYAHTAREQGMDPLFLTTIDLSLFFARLAGGKFMYTQHELEIYVTTERALIRQTRPNLVVGDFRLTLSISARLEGVPLLSLMQAHWSPFAPVPLPALRGGWWGALPDFLRRGLFCGLRPLAYRVFARPWMPCANVTVPAPARFSPKLHRWRALRLPRPARPTDRKLLFPPDLQQLTPWRRNTKNSSQRQPAKSGLSAMQLNVVNARSCESAIGQACAPPVPTPCATTFAKSSMP